MQLLREGDGVAVVRVQHASHAYDIRLSQPAHPGTQQGIWVVDSMRRADLSSSGTGS